MILKLIGIFFKHLNIFNKQVNFYKIFCCQDVHSSEEKYPLIILIGEFLHNIQDG